MPRLIDWLGSIMFLVAILEFAPSPKKALRSITHVLSTNVHIENGQLGLTNRRRK